MGQMGSPTPAPPPRQEKRMKALESQPKSWAESVQRYESAKKALQFTQPNPNIHSRQKGREFEELHSAWDPILAGPKSASYRDELRKKEEEKMIRAVNRGLQHDLDKSSTAYDLLTFNPKFGLTQAQADECSRQERKSGLKFIAPDKTPFDIITLKQKADMPPPKDLAHVKESEFSHKYDRNFNLVNGQYLQDNARRQQEKEQRVRDKVMQRFVETHDYHPIVAQYYDEDKELRTRDAEAEQRRVKTAQLHADVGTQSVLRSEGHAFNILTAETYHEDKVRRLDEAANARPHVHAEYRHRNAQYVDALEEMYGKKDEAAVRRRQRPERMGAHITQGFDITTGQAFGMSRDEFRHASPERQLADTVKSVSHPPVSKEILKPQTVKGKLDAIAQSDAASQSLTRIPRGPPKTTFERTMLLPPGDPAATRPQFAKSSRAPVTSAAEFLNSSRTRSEPRPELAATL